MTGEEGPLTFLLFCSSAVLLRCCSVLLPWNPASSEFCFLLRLLRLLPDIHGLLSGLDPLLCSRALTLQSYQTTLTVVRRWRVSRKSACMKRFVGWRRCPRLSSLQEAAISNQIWPLAPQLPQAIVGIIPPCWISSNAIPSFSQPAAEHFQRRNPTTCNATPWLKCRLQRGRRTPWFYASYPTLLTLQYSPLGKGSLHSEFSILHNPPHPHHPLSQCPNQTSPVKVPIACWISYFGWEREGDLIWWRLLLWQSTDDER
jgi:hypothetical protein